MVVGLFRRVPLRMDGPGWFMSTRSASERRSALLLATATYDFEWEWRDSNPHVQRTPGLESGAFAIFATLPSCFGGFVGSRSPPSVVTTYSGQGSWLIDARIRVNASD